MPTALELEALAPGEELDRAIERSLIVGGQCGVSPCPHSYSTDPIAALTLIEMCAPRWDADVTIERRRDGVWTCSIDANLDGGWESEGSGSTIAEAICKAVAQEMDESPA